MISASEKDTLKKIELINSVLKQFENGEDDQILASDLMPEFIAAKVFERDYNNGFPIRRFLDSLRDSNQLHLIPYARASGSKWYFDFYKPEKYDRKDSDENYVIGLCDEILNQQALRQHKFDFLLSNETKKGKRINLPVDAYYPNYQLVVEYLEEHHFSKDVVEDKNYDEHRRRTLPQNGIKLLEIEFYSFTYHHGTYRIIRREAKDLEIVRQMIQSKLGVIF